MTEHVIIPLFLYLIKLAKNRSVSIFSHELLFILVLDLPNNAANNIIWKIYYIHRVQIFLLNVAERGSDIKLQIPNICTSILDIIHYLLQSVLRMTTTSVAQISRGIWLVGWGNAVDWNFAYRSFKLKSVLKAFRFILRNGRNGIRSYGRRMGLQLPTIRRFQRAFTSGW